MKYSTPRPIDTQPVQLSFKDVQDLNGSFRVDCARRTVNVDAPFRDEHRAARWISDRRNSTRAQAAKCRHSALGRTQSAHTSKVHTLWHS